MQTNEYLIDNANKEETEKNFQKIFQAHSIPDDKQGSRIIIQTPLTSQSLAIILKEEGIDYIE